MRMVIFEKDGRRLSTPRPAYKDPRWPDPEFQRKKRPKFWTPPRIPTEMPGNTRIRPPKRQKCPRAYFPVFSEVSLGVPELGACQELKKGIHIKNLGRNPPPRPPSQGTPDPRNSLCLGPLFPSKYSKRPTSRISRGGILGPQSSLCWISSPELGEGLAAMRSVPTVPWIVIFFSPTEAPLPDPTPTPPNTPKRTRNGAEQSPNGAKRSRNGPQSSPLGWERRGGLSAWGGGRCKGKENHYP